MKRNEKQYILLNFAIIGLFSFICLLFCSIFTESTLQIVLFRFILRTYLLAIYVFESDVSLDEQNNRTTSI